MNEEIHAYAFMSKPGALARIRKSDRLAILRHFIDTIEKLPGINIVNVIVDKHKHVPPFDPFTVGWQTLIQRLENTVKSRKFHGPPLSWKVYDRAMVFPDDTDQKKLRSLLRKMRKYNPVPNMASLYASGYNNLPLEYVIEDPHFKDSYLSYFSQAADCVAYMLYQREVPSKYIRAQTGHGYFGRLDRSLCRVASSKDPKGIVRR